jgi:N-acetylglucosaminyldiphosphoundecaprenol N-acetyl-beta-D-mannosaminyltransferase
MDPTEVRGPKKIHFLNIPVDNISLDDLDEKVKQMLENDEVLQIVFINTFDLLRARRNGEFEQCLRLASLVIPTSKGLIRGAKFVHNDKLVRHMPFEFIIRLLGALERQNKSLYILGQNQSRVINIENNLRVSFPALKIVGRFQGFFPDEMKPDILTAIKKAAPSLLLAGRGLKGKDMWLFYNRKQLNPGINVWSGECFDIFSGKKERTAKQAWESGSYKIGEFIRRPWRCLRIFIYMYYGILLIIHRIKQSIK